MIGGVTRLGGLPGLLGRVTLLAGIAFCHVNVSRWGNPPTRGQSESVPNYIEFESFRRFAFKKLVGSTL